MVGAPVIDDTKWPPKGCCIGIVWAQGISSERHFFSVLQAQIRTWAVWTFLQLGDSSSSAGYPWLPSALPQFYLLVWGELSNGSPSPFQDCRSPAILLESRIYLLGTRWRFPEMGLPLVLIHFWLGFSLKLKIQRFWDPPKLWKTQKVSVSSWPFAPTGKPIGGGFEPGIWSCWSIGNGVVRLNSKQFPWDLELIYGFSWWT